MSALRVERDGALLRIAMARPERRNAFDAALIEELTGAFADVGDVRAVLLTGDGPSFSAGADVEWMRSSVELSHDENVADALRLRAMLDAIDGCPAPVVARVQGHALGGGCGLVACCDIVVAEPGAQFAFSEVKLGIVPAVISPFALAKIGSSAARRYFVTGERFSAEVALRIGLVHEVADDLDGAVERVLARAARRQGRRQRARRRRSRARRSRRGDGGADRRAPHERRGPGGPARVPREAPALHRRSRGVFADEARTDGVRPQPCLRAATFDRNDAARLRTCDAGPHRPNGQAGSDPGHGRMPGA